MPLGGCGEFGMNTTCYIIDGKLFVVDCGLRFTDPSKLGTDAVIPAVDPIFEQFGGVYAYLITHAHEDHIGGLPFILPRWPAPIYTTRWSAAVLKIKFAKRGIDEKHFPITIVQPGDHVRCLGFDAEWVHVNHSIPDACALFIQTSAGNIFHTGDFKFDANPVLEPPLQEEALATIASRRVDLLLADSTNSEREGNSPSESSVFRPLLRAFQSCKGAIVLSTFASNFWRLKTIADICVAANKRLYVTGPGIDQSFEIASKLGLYELPPNLRVTDETIHSVAREDLVVLATGCQGEFRSALSRIALGEHRQFRLQEGDTVILSSRIIPGNERSILFMIDQLKRRGANIITTRNDDGIHVSGHAYRNDLSRMFTQLKPRWYTPVHGAFSQLHANRALGITLGLEPERVLLIENGDVIIIDEGNISVRTNFSVGLEYIDSDSGVVISYESLRERLRIGESGLALVSGVFDRCSNDWKIPPSIELVGIKLPYHIAQESWLDQQSAVIKAVVSGHPGETSISADEIREQIRVNIRRSLFGVLRKKPTVVVKIHFL